MRNDSGPVVSKSINGLVTDGNTLLCCCGFVLAKFQITTANKIALNVPEIIQGYSQYGATLKYYKLQQGLSLYIMGI